jgi:hypothetical protein
MSAIPMMPEAATPLSGVFPGRGKQRHGGDQAAFLKAFGAALDSLLQQPDEDAAELEAYAGGQLDHEEAELAASLSADGAGDLPAQVVESAYAVVAMLYARAAVDMDAGDAEETSEAQLVEPARVEVSQEPDGTVVLDVIPATSPLEGLASYDEAVLESSDDAEDAEMVLTERTEQTTVVVMDEPAVTAALEDVELAETAESATPTALVGRSDDAAEPIAVPTSEESGEIAVDAEVSADAEVPADAEIPTDAEVAVETDRSDSSAGEEAEVAATTDRSAHTDPAAGEEPEVAAATDRSADTDPAAGEEPEVAFGPGRSAEAPAATRRPPASERAQAVAAPNAAVHRAEAASADVQAAPLAGPAPAAPAAPAPAGLVNRVLEAIEQLEHRPPPRRMVVEVGDMRLTVALRGDEVRLSVVGARSGSELSAEWARDISQALASRGFNLSQGDREGAQRDRPEQPEDRPAPPRTTARRLPNPAASAGWRL